MVILSLNSSTKVVLNSQLSSESKMQTADSKLLNGGKTQTGTKVRKYRAERSHQLLFFSARMVSSRKAFSPVKGKDGRGLHINERIKILTFYSPGGHSE